MPAHIGARRAMNLGAITPGAGGGGLPKLVNPRIGLIGPSTVQYNHFGFSNNRVSALLNGPIVWALMKDRRADLLITASASGKGFDGDNQGQAGATFPAYPAQIGKLNARLAGVTNKIVFYEPGRNPIQENATLANYQSAIQRDISALRAGGFKFILLAKIWKKPMAYGGGWADGGAYRTLSDEINAWIDTFASGSSDIIPLNFQACMQDPASPNGDTYPGVTVSDNTHLTAKGAELLAAEVNRALATIAEPQAYPSTPAENVIPPFSGATGTVSGGPTGEVYDGWSVVQSASGISVTCSRISIDGKPYQRLTVTNTQGAPAAGVNVTLRRTSVALKPGAYQGWRCKLKLSASAVPMLPFFQLGTAAVPGVSPYARAIPIVSLNDGVDSPIGGAGANFQGAVKMDLSTAKDLRVESHTPILAAAGGANAGFELLFTVGPAGSASDTLVIDVGELQTFDWVNGL